MRAKGHLKELQQVSVKPRNSLDNVLALGRIMSFTQGLDLALALLIVSICCNLQRRDYGYVSPD